MEAIAKAPVTATTVVRDFVWVNNSRSQGWRPATIPQFDPGSQYHVAHDTLEHLDQHDPSLEAEQKAFGAYLFIRGDGNYWVQKNAWIGEDDPLSFLFTGSYTDPAQHMAHDFFSFLYENPRVLAEPPAAPKVPHEEELVMKHLLHIGKENARDHLIGPAGKSGQDWMERVQRAFGWMRIGYLEAQQRYGALPPNTRSSMFIAIEKVTGDITDPLYEDHLKNGDTLTIKVDMADRTVAATIHTVKGKVIAQKNRKF